MPPGKGPFPALLLLPGSGPTDRDGNSGMGIQTDILKQIAESLALKGVASLRFDKRAIARYSLQWPKDLASLNQFFSYRNFVDDAKAAYADLRSQPGVDPSRCGILGHSEGGLFALQIGSELAGRPDAPNKLLLLSTAGRPMGEVIHDQLKRRLSGPGVPQELGDRLLRYSDDACAALTAGRPLPPNTPAELKALYNPTVIDILTNYVRIDPAELAKKCVGPVLVLNGGDDTQVSPTLDAPRLARALRSRDKGAVKMVIVPGASHNLKSTAQQGPDAFGGTVVPEAMEAIVGW